MKINDIFQIKNFFIINKNNYKYFKLLIIVKKGSYSNIVLRPLMGSIKEFIKN
jgi:hypothetical protein